MPCTFHCPMNAVSFSVHMYMYECVSTFNQESHAPVFTVVDTVASEWSSAVDAAVSSAVLWITALCEMRTKVHAPNTNTDPPPYIRP